MTYTSAIESAIARFADFKEELKGWQKLAL